MNCLYLKRKRNEDEKSKSNLWAEDTLSFIGILIYSLIGILLFGCSTTKHLPEGEVLYTGNKDIFKDPSKTSVGETAIGEVRRHWIKARQPNYLVFCLSFWDVGVQ